MRILLTVHQFFPDHATGTEVLTYQVAKALGGLGHEVRIVSGYPMKRAPDLRMLFDRYEYDGLDVARYYHHEGAAVGSQSNIAEVEYDNHLFSHRFSGLLTEWRPNVVHFFHLKNLSATAIDVCHSAGIPMVLTPTDFWIVCPTTQLLLPDGSLCEGPDAKGVNCLRHAVANTQSPAFNWIFGLLPDPWISAAIRASGWSVVATRPPFSWVCALAARTDFLRRRIRLLDCILAPTHFMEGILRKNGMLPKNLQFSRFGIDLDGPGPLITERGTSDVLRVGFIGSLAHPKGAHVLIDAVRRIAPSVRLEVPIFGNPSVYPGYARELGHLAEADPRISFRGTFPNHDIAKVLSDMDILVVPSLWYENTPLVIYSAQAAGCPVVASDLGGMSEVIRDGIDGLLFPAGDSQALANIIERLDSDRNLVRVLAENVPRPKSIGEYVNELEGIYQQLLSPKDGKS